MWSKIAGSIPNIAPKGQLNGSTINVTYDNANDPDCCEFSFLPSPPPFGSDSWGWRGELGPHVVHVAKDMHAKSAPRHLTWCPLMRRLSRARFLPRFARQNVPLTVSYDFKQGGRSDNVRPQRSQGYHRIYSTFRNPRRWAMGLTTDPIARTTSFTTISRARTKRRPCSSSGATSSTGHSRRSAQLLTGMRSVLVSCFLFRRVLE